jgi:hypothetical protein
LAADDEPIIVEFAFYRNAEKRRITFLDFASIASEAEASSETEQQCNHCESRYIKKRFDCICPDFFALTRR